MAGPENPKADEGRGKQLSLVEDEPTPNAAAPDDPTIAGDASTQDVSAAQSSPESDQRHRGSRRSRKRKAMQEFFLPVSGFVWFSDAELEVINHPAFQRLAKINQLGFAHLVFRGATHTRLEHVLGAVGVAERVISAIERNAQSERTKLSKHEKVFVRLGALLHDIGHIASGHTLEDELGILDKHDEDERLYIVYHKKDRCGESLADLTSAKAARDIEELADIETKPLREIIDDAFADSLPPSLQKKTTPGGEKVTATDLVWILTRKPPSARTEAGIEAELEADIDSLEKEVGRANRGTGSRKERLLQVRRTQLSLHAKQKLLNDDGSIRLDVCGNIIGNTICADLLDYISRDWFHVGKPLAIEDRVFQYMEIQEGARSEGEPAPRRADRFVVALGEGTKIRRDGVSAILGLLERRYELAETVLYHKTKLAAGAVLDRALFEITDRSEESDLIEAVLCLSDEQLVDYAIKRAAEFREKTDDRRRAALKLLGNLRMRILPKPLIAFDSSRHRDERDYLGQLYAPNPTDPHASAMNRTATARGLERDFGLPPGSIVMSCTVVKPKIAKVAIRVNDCVEEFDQYEKDHRNELSGGHLLAQIERFERLWRLDFFMNEREMEVQENLGTLDLITDAVRYVVASTAPYDEKLRQARRIARELVEMRSQHGPRLEFVQDGVPEAARGTVRNLARYPNGAEAISFFIGGELGN